jgi:hypothetical protein
MLFLVIPAKIDVSKLAYRILSVNPFGNTQEQQGYEFLKDKEVTVHQL